MKTRLLLSLIFVIAGSVCIPAQQTEKLPAQTDSVRIMELIDHAGELEFTDIDSAFVLAAEATAAADKSGSYTLVYEAYRLLGGLNLTIGDHTHALEADISALNAARKLNDGVKIGAMYNNIGLVYERMGDNDAALENLEIALGYFQKENYLPYLANCYLNIGVVYQAIGTMDEALDYFRKADSLYVIQEDMGGRGTVMNDVGLVHLDMGRPDSAKHYFQMSFAMHASLGEFDGMSVAANNVGDCFLAMHQYDSAFISFRNGYIFGDSLDAFDLQYDGLFGMSKAKAGLREYEAAYSFLQQALAFNDSMNTEESTQKYADLRAGYDRDFKEQQLFIQKLETEKANKEKTLLTIILFSSGVFVIVLVLVFINRYKIKQRANVLLCLKNEQIEERNKNITDSITYARLIQEGLLPDQGEIQTQLGENFILYLPKDIVSGDFYWTASVDGYTFLAVADCTGHGVPGGFMSVLGSSLLNEIILEQKVIEPAEVLDKMRNKIIRSLKQEENIRSNKDGMDIVLVRFELASDSVCFAGAYNPLWLCRGGVIREFSTDKQPVGLHVGEHLPFASLTLTTQQGDMLYLFTDGLADQFGGPQGKKFKYKQLREVLEKNSTLLADQQKSELNKLFHEWKGELEQVDDVLVVGIRI